MDGVAEKNQERRIQKMKEKTIKVEKTVKYVAKEELTALGYHEMSEMCEKSMSKDYPTGKKWVGYAIFDKISDPGIKEGYWRDRNFMTLHSYQMGDDPKEFLETMKKAIEEYRSDMMKLGLLEEKK